MKEIETIYSTINEKEIKIFSNNLNNEILVKIFLKVKTVRKFWWYARVYLKFNKRLSTFAWNISTKAYLLKINFKILKISLE
jgi:hypothetical protein